MSIGSNLNTCKLKPNSYINPVIRSISVLNSNDTYCPEIVFCIYNQLLPILILKCVDIVLFVKNGVECSSNLSQNKTKKLQCKNSVVTV